MAQNLKLQSLECDLYDLDIQNLIVSITRDSFFEK